MSATAKVLADFVARRLDERSDELVQRWIDWTLEQICNPVVQALPRDAIRNNIPPVLKSLARFVRNPTFALREEMLGNLRLHGQIRCDQGYGLCELLAEFEALAQLVESEMRDEVAAVRSDWPIGELLMVFGRLSTGLRAVVFVAGGTYRETEQMRATTLARHLSEFGQSIAHELRSPLQAVLIAAAALEDEQIVADARLRAEQIDVVKAGAKHAGGLLDDINLLSSTETARAESRMQELSVVLDIVRQEMTHIADEAGAQLRFPVLKSTVAVEGVVAQMVLVNLFSNGIKYADPEKHDRWVRLDVEMIDEEGTPFVRMEVSDNGLGVPEEFQTNVFQRKFRAHPNVAAGTGLGLAICQSLITERGGTIEMRSEVGEGSVFTFTLRAVDVQRPLASGYYATTADKLITQSVENLETAERVAEPADQKEDD